FGADGLYLLWPAASTRLLGLIPRSIRDTAGLASHEDLLRHLLNSRSIHASPSSVVHIRPPGHVKPQGAVRIADAECILHEIGVRVVPLGFRLSVTGSSARADGDDVAAAKSQRNNAA